MYNHPPEGWVKQKQMEKQGISKIDKEAENLEYLASTMTMEHQKSARMELLRKAENLRNLSRETGEELTIKEEQK